MENIDEMPKYHKLIKYQEKLYTYYEIGYLSLYITYIFCRIFSVF